MVGDAGKPRVDVAAAEVLGADHLAGRRLHQRRAAEEDRALLLDDDRLVGHRRHIGAARRARAHDHGDLRNALRRHVGLVVEDAAEMIAVGKHLVLVGQIGAAGIDQIDAGQPVLPGDLLGAQVLLHRHRIIGAALHRGVVADHHDLATLDAADPGDQPGGRDVAAIHAVRGETRRSRGTATPDREAGARARAAAACRARDAARGHAAGLPQR